MTGLEYAAPCAVAGRALLSLPGKGAVPSRALHAGELVEEAATLGARVVLVHAEALSWWGMPAEIPGKMTSEKAMAERAEVLAAQPFMRDAAAAGWVLKQEGGWRTRLRGPQGALWSSVVWLPYEISTRDVSGPWKHAATYSELVLALSRFGHTAGFGWQDSVGRTAERLIVATHPREKGGAELDRQVAVPEPWRKAGQIEQVYKWRRPFTDGERAGSTHIHGYDANAQFLAAWLVAELGHGEPQLATEFTTSTPGIWKLDPKWDWAAIEEQLLPGPACPVDGEWVTTPTVRRIFELCEMAHVTPPAPLDGWVWPQQYRFLRGAAERLRDARAELLTDTGPAAQLAREAVKSIYKVETGRFTMSRRDEFTGWHRPDWGDLIRGTARANLHRRLAGTLGGPRSAPRPALLYPPFAIDVDALYIAGDVADPIEFAQLIGLPLGEGLGEFKILGTSRVDAERMDLLEGAPTLVATKRAWAQMVTADKVAPA